MWMENLHAMFPAIDEATVRYFLVHRERYVEPLHGLNSAHLIPAVETPVRSLFLVTTAANIIGVDERRIVGQPAWP